MQKNATIMAIVLISLIFIGGMTGAYLAASSSYRAKSATVAEELEKTTVELEALKAAKDANGYTATETVKAFFTEAKTGSLDKAKVYLGPEVQAMDIKATLKLGNDLANITTSDNLEEIVGDNTNVSMTFVLADETTTLRVFELTRYNDVWKITGVTAE